MSRSYKKTPCSNFDSGNHGRHKSFKTPLMRQAINALRRKGYKIDCGRKKVCWDWEFQSISNFLQALDSSSRSYNYNERILYEGYCYWLESHDNTEDTRKNRILYAKSQIREFKKK